MKGWVIMDEIRFYSWREIEALCEVKRTKAYQIIAQLNGELEAQGYIVPKAGRVPKAYADKRLGLTE